VSAAQLACKLQVPIPLVIVTVFPAIVQAPDAMILGLLLAFVVAETRNWEPNCAVAGDPVNVTIGVA
jgi:hypothetical protein